MFTCGCGLLISGCIALHPLVLGLQICCLFPCNLLHGLGCLDIRLNIQFFLFNMRFSRYMCASHSHAWRVEMERFELLTLLSLQQPFFQKNDMIIIQGYPYKAISYSVYYMGLSGLEPPTSRLSGVRSNRLSYKPRLILQKPSCHIITLLYMFSVIAKPLFTAKLLLKSGSHLLSHAVSSIVPSAA